MNKTRSHERCHQSKAKLKPNNLCASSISAQLLLRNIPLAWCISTWWFFVFLLKGNYSLTNKHLMRFGNDFPWTSGFFIAEIHKVHRLSKWRLKLRGWKPFLDELPKLRQWNRPSRGCQSSPVSDPVDTLLNRRPDSYSRFEGFTNGGYDIISNLGSGSTVRVTLKTTQNSWSMKHAVVNVVNCMPFFVISLLTSSRRLLTRVCDTESVACPIYPDYFRQVHRISR